MKHDPLLLLHGWGMNTCAFAPLLRCLDTGNALNCALPGYPASRWQAQTSFDGQLERMAADLPAGHLLGWSLGGIYAIELAARYPGRFTALTLIACNPCFVVRSDWRCAIEASVIDAFSDELTRDWRRALRRFIALQMRGETRARGLARQVWEGLEAAGEPGPGVLEFGLELLKTHDARPALGDIRQPLRLILGGRDPLVPADLERQIADIAPGIRVEFVAGAAHAPMISHPAQVAAML